MRHREDKEHTQGLTASKWHSCYSNTDLRSDSRTFSLTTVLYVSQKEKRLRVSVSVHFYSLCGASTRDWLFLNSWVSHSGAARWVVILKIIWTYIVFSVLYHRLNNPKEDREQVGAYLKEMTSSDFYQLH